MEFGKDFGTEFVEDYGATEPVNSPGGGYGETLPPNSQGGGYGATAPMNGTGMGWEGGATYASGDGGFFRNEPMNETLPPEHGNGFEANDLKSNSGVEDYDDVTLPPVMDGIEGFTPIVGWLVCVEGPSKGADYRLRAGYNYIGRSEHMDVCIKGDTMIGRERHAMVAYDQEERVFFFGPVDGKSTVRLNGKMVMVPSELHPNDMLKIGATQLMFVPLCGERFNWDV